jgi:hypothetical protein
VNKLWRNRQWVKGALSELGCGMLTMLFVTVPLWVITLATRGPAFALAVLAGLILLFIAIALGSKLLKRS